MDKNHVVMIAVGAFIVGGLTVAASVNMEGYGWRGGDDYGRGYQKQGMMGANYQTDMKSQESNDARGNMMGDGGMGMGGMHDMSMMVQSEREFIEEMIPHHTEAIATAKEVVARGGSTPEIKTLAENIIKAQESEVAEMKTWYKNWYGVEYVVDGTYKPMMRSLTNLSGAALDRVFLSDMIMHHMSAIMMANSVTPYIEHPEITTLTTNIKTSQSAEITLMQNLLKTL